VKKLKTHSSLSHYNSSLHIDGKKYPINMLDDYLESKNNTNHKQM